MPQQSSLIKFGFKKARLDDDSPLSPPSSTVGKDHHPNDPSPSSDTENVVSPAGPQQRQQEEGLPADLSALDEPPSQPKLKKFPYTVNHGKARCFSSRWYDDFTWVEYSQRRDAIFCKMCRSFPSRGAEGAFTRDGYTDWKHLRLSLERHQKSEHHSMSMSRFECYKGTQTSGRGNVVHQMNPDARNHDFIERNRDHLKVILDIVLFCAKQDISLRGHRETDEDLNKGNFLELFEFMCKYDPEIKARLDELPRNATLMSPDMQNELLMSAASLLLRKIKDEVHETSGTYYALMADEYKDASKRELVAVCIRYIHAEKIKERAIGFMDTSDMSAKGISEKILQIIEPLQLDPSLCAGFSFDGASVMSGEKGGVQTILKETFPGAIYVHCSSHRLNLVLSAATKSSGHVSTFFETVNSLHHFFTGSSRHARFIEVQKELRPGRPCLELERSTDTRWSSKSGSVDKILTLLDVILEVLEEYAETGSGQTKLEAQSLLQQMQTKKFIFLLVTFGKLFETSDFATKGLQSPALSVSGCIDLIEGLKERFAQYRDKPECVFQQVMKLTDELMQKHGIINWDVSVGTRERRLPARLSGSVVTTSLGKATSVRTDEDLRRTWNDILDR